MREVVYNLLEMTERGVRSQGNMSHVATVSSPLTTHHQTSNSSAVAVQCIVVIVKVPSLAIV